MARQITFHGSPLTLVGRMPQENQVIPDFSVSALDLQTATLKDFSGKIKIFTTFPSLDTPVCDLQLKEFNKRATNLADSIAVVAISKDLPFAQKRFCEVNAIKNVGVFSDYKTSSFGMRYGILIKELNLLARTVFIADAQNILRYREIVPELTMQPNYEQALGALEKILKLVPENTETVPSAYCLPCEGGVQPLSEGDCKERLKKLTGWKMVNGKKIEREFSFQIFSDLQLFSMIIASLAEQEGHHPRMEVTYTKVKVILTTHAVGGLTTNDFHMAEIIEQVCEI